MVKATYGLPLSFAKLEGDSDADIITLYWWDSVNATWTPVLRIKGSTGEVEVIGDILQSITLRTGSPAVNLEGTETGAIKAQVKEDAGVVKITDATNGVDMAIFNSTGVMQLLLKSVSPTLGTGGTLGAASTISPDLRRIIPQGVKITIGGTLATGESVTVRVTFNFDDGTSLYVDKTYSATGDDYLAEADLQSLWKNGVGISSIDVQAASSATTTSATATVQVRGIQY